MATPKSTSSGKPAAQSGGEPHAAPEDRQIGAPKEKPLPSTSPPAPPLPPPPADVALTVSARSVGAVEPGEPLETEPPPTGATVPTRRLPPPRGPDPLTAYDVEVNRRRWIAITLGGLVLGLAVVAFLTAQSLITTLMTLARPTTDEPKLRDTPLIAAATLRGALVTALIGLAIKLLAIAERMLLPLRILHERDAAEKFRALTGQASGKLDKDAKE